ncbi:MAG: sodium:proton antiporter [Candidatus Latescibacterota bacterium]
MKHPENWCARRRLVLFAMLLAAVMVASPVAASDTNQHLDESHHGPGLGAELALWTCLPFAGILLSIALFPLIAPRFWHHHFPKASAFWAAVFAVPFLIAFRGEALHEILHVYIIDYIPFIILLWALFTVSGGILVRGTLRGSPLLNTLLLLIGTALASWIGTTGASMVLIRPVLRANAWRKRKVHVVVFFIFLVSNIGGALTPLGDPPLFLGFLHGVPFFWTLNLILPMLLVVVPILTIFFIIDTLYMRREERPEAVKGEPVKIEGLHNLIFLAGIVGAVLMSGFWSIGTVNILGVEQKIQFLMRDAIMITMGFLSLRTTSKATHEGNEFTWFPIKEVAILFAGIFMTIIPALAILKAGEQGQMAGMMRALSAPVHYYWITGGLSSFLDNAPTYLTFFNTILGKFYTGTGEAEAVGMLIRDNGTYLLAISTGAVFFGAITYIGNAPNFMVKSIAEEAGVPMPSFFGYMFKFSLVILVPLFFVVTTVFFRWW